MIIVDPLPETLLHPACPIVPGMDDPAITIAWLAHVAAGRIGATPALPDDGRDRRCAGLARALGGRHAHDPALAAEETRSGGDVAST